MNQKMIIRRKGELKKMEKFQKNIMENAIDEPKTSKFDPVPCVDHLGNQYPSKSSMCRSYGIPDNVFCNRTRSGWTLERALTEPCHKHSKSPKSKRQSIKISFRGILYPSKKALCEAYKISYTTFLWREHHGWSLEDILTTPIASNTKNNGEKASDSSPSVDSSDDESASCEVIGETFVNEEEIIAETANETYDFLGNCYPSLNAMCKQYRITREKFLQRIADGKMLKEALLGD